VNATLTVVSRNETVVQYVGDFAKGLGCGVAAGTEPGARVIRIQLADTGDLLVELLDYVALAAIRAGVDIDEPLCRLRYRREGSVQVTLSLRCVELGLDQ